MQTRISPREAVLLSEYLDGRLDKNQRARLEARLKVSPELRSMLEDMRRTRAILRSVPRLRAPRSFRLTPQMIGVRSPRRIYPVFQFASALAGVMLVFVIVVDIFLSRISQTASPMMVAKEYVVEVTQSVESDGSAPRAPGAAEQQPPSVEPKQAEALTSPLLTTQPPAYTAESGGIMTLGMTATLEFTSTAVTIEITQEVALAPQNTATPPPGSNIPREATQIASLPSDTGQAVTLLPTGQPEIVGQPKGWLDLRLIEVALIILLIGLVVAALLLRRKERRFL